MTVESFLSWKEKFDEEMGFTKRKDLAEREGKKLTGKELFMTDKTLDQSDLKFLDDGNLSYKLYFSVNSNLRSYSPTDIDNLTYTLYYAGDAVKVDESLFQNMDDLDSEDDEDDPDFDPNISDNSA